MNDYRPWEPFDSECSELRIRLKALSEPVRNLMGHPTFAQPPEASKDFGEMKANIMLAYRHIEDAQMRLGKAIQAFDGGKSVYDPKDALRMAKGSE